MDEPLDWGGYSERRYGHEGLRQFLLSEEFRSNPPEVGRATDKKRSSLVNCFLGIDFFSGKKLVVKGCRSNLPEPGSLILEWKIYLDDAAPNKGNIDLVFAFLEEVETPKS